jgi:crossover junction endodeoxyribonuclease RuvC
MLVLGLDPGLATTGYGLVSGDGQNVWPLAFGVVRTQADWTMPQRLLRLEGELQALIDQYRPDVAAVEELFFSSNVTTAIKVAQARGVALLTMAKAGLEVVEYTPMQVKQGITGYGLADKPQMQEMVRLLLNLDELPRPDDAADALAVAICCHFAHRLQSLLQQGPEP